MAITPIEGKRYVVLIDSTNTGVTYDLIVCLTANSFVRTANVIDASSKCGTAKLNGIKDRTITIEGNVQLDPESGTITEGGLNDIFENDTKVAWLFGPEPSDVQADEVFYTGTDAILSDLTLAAPQEGALTFSGTLQLNGVPVKHEGS